MDATTVCVNSTPEEKVVVIPERMAPRQASEAHTAKSWGNVFVKYYCLASADGVLGTPVYVLNDKDMEKDEIDVFELLGMGIDSSPHAKCYVVCCKDSDSNKNFFKWLMQTVILPHIAAVRRKLGVTGEPGSDKSDTDFPAVLTFDGEYHQVDQVMKNHLGVRDAIDEAGLVIIKLPASCSSTLQPCDVMVLFMALKKALKALDKVMMQQVLKSKETSIEQDIEAINERSVTKGKEQRRKWVHALVLVSVSLQKAYCWYNVQVGFRMTGQCPYNPTRTLSCCPMYSTLMTTQPLLLDNILAALPRLGECFARDGCLLETEMDELGLPDTHDSDKKRKDARVPNKQRALRLTGEAVFECIERYKTAMAAKRSKDNTSVAALQAELSVQSIRLAKANATTHRVREMHKQIEEEFKDAKRQIREMKKETASERKARTDQELKVQKQAEKKAQQARVKKRHRQIVEEEPGYRMCDGCKKRKNTSMFSFTCCPHCGVYFSNCCYETHLCRASDDRDSTSSAKPQELIGKSTSSKKPRT